MCAPYPSTSDEWTRAGLPWFYSPFAAPLYSVLGFFLFFFFFSFYPPLFFSLSSLLTSVVNRMASLSRAADKINRNNRQKFLSTFFSPLVSFFSRRGWVSFLTCRYHVQSSAILDLCPSISLQTQALVYATLA